MCDIPRDADDGRFRDEQHRDLELELDYEYALMVDYAIALGLDPSDAEWMMTEGECGDYVV